MLNRLRPNPSSSFRNLSATSTTSKSILRQTSSIHFHPIFINSSHPPRSDPNFQHSYLRNYATQSSTNPSYNMSIEQSMREKLQKELDPIKLNIRNDSSKHSHHAAMVAQGGGSGETHFFIEVISDSFKGKPQLARHRLINGILKQEFENGLHALSLRLKTGEEEEKGMKA